MHTQDFERAKRVLESLIHGNDPVTASELPPDAVVNRIEVNRALIIALAAVKETAARIAREVLTLELTTIKSLRPSQNIFV